MARWMLTGGAGYIGSHVLDQIRTSGQELVVVDDLSTGLATRIPDDVPFVECNVLDRSALAAAMRDYNVEGVIHFAAKKAVGESVERPLYYYRQNIDGVLSLLEAMSATGVSKIVYSSSAAVYGEPKRGQRVSEDAPTVPTSPYGETKLAGEWAVKSEARARAVAGSALSFVLLRYFNVAGAASPLLGDTSVANLIPLVFRAIAMQQRPKIFGSDYPTADGTCIRDYIHVVDLADAHLAAVRACDAAGAGSVQTIYNVGTGTGNSVKEVMDVVSRVVGFDVNPETADRRAGDPALLVAKADRIQRELGWHAKLSLDHMVESAWAAWPKS